MKLLLSWTVLLLALDVVRCVPAQPPGGVSEETLKQLSADGGRLVDEEVQRALYGVQQMKEVTWRNQEKHRHLLQALRHSGDKQKGAAQLAKDVTEKLQEAEQCRPCLEDACKAFYTSTCRRGFAAFHSKVGAFFRRISERFTSRQLGVDSGDSGDSGDILVNQGPGGPDSDVDRIQESFERLLRRVGALVNCSAALVSRMSGRLDRSLQTAFLSQNPDPAAEPTPDPFPPARDSAFMQGVGLEEVLESFFDFGQSVVEEFGAVVTRVFDDLQQVVEEQKKSETEHLPQFLQNRKLCRSLRQQTSECWRLQTQCAACQGALLTECPSVRELHVELEEVSQLLEVSRDQYQEVLNIVRRHADDTVAWLSAVASELSWVGRAAGNGSAPNSSFTVTKVVLQSQDEGEEPAPETQVEVNILNSAPLSLTVPGQLQLHHPAFIQQVVQEALDKYKEMDRLEDE